MRLVQPTFTHQGQPVPTTLRRHRPLPPQQQPQSITSDVLYQASPLRADAQYSRAAPTRRGHVTTDLLYGEEQTSAWQTEEWTPRRRHRRPRARFFFVIGMLLAVGGYLLITQVVLPAFENVSDQVAYGSGRVSSVDLSVGHGPGPSHFLAQIYGGQVLIIELDGAVSTSKSMVYTLAIPQLDNGHVVTLTAQDLNHDHLVDLLITIEGEPISLVLYNNGKTFQSVPPSVAARQMGGGEGGGLL